MGEVARDDDLQSDERRAAQSQTDAEPRSAMARAADPHRRVKCGCRCIGPQRASSNERREARPCAPIGRGASLEGEARRWELWRMGEGRSEH